MGTYLLKIILPKNNTVLYNEQINNTGLFHFRYMYRIESILSLEYFEFELFQELNHLWSVGSEMCHLSLLFIDFLQ